MIADEIGDGMLRAIGAEQGEVRQCVANGGYVCFLCHEGIPFRDRGASLGVTRSGDSR